MNSNSNNGKKISLGKILLILVVVILVFRFFGSSANDSSYESTPVTVVSQPQTVESTPAPKPAQESPKPAQSTAAGFVASPITQNYGSSGSAWTLGSNNGVLNSSVDGAARDKFTNLRGNSKDTVTIMVYMCGTDLESQSGMATADLKEMAGATLGSNVNLIVMTGGCRRWQISGISTSVNQIYKIENGSMTCLVKDGGNKSMADPDNLASFIQYCVKNYPADRRELILWDHGGGSVSGYGYDEKHSSSDSMVLYEIRNALKAGGTTFDFIGFDACLMATYENALMLSDYADYMIASEESEPGTGWYYTNWLTALSQNTSMPTVNVGKQIADDFVSYTQRYTRGQSATLSVIDLAELQATAPALFSEFTGGITEMLNDNGYSTISGARKNSRGFGTSSRLDQVDLIHMAANVGSEEGSELAQALLSAVKYNASNMTNAYGLAFYFPYYDLSSVNTAIKSFDALGMDKNFTECIRSFASYQTGGQAAGGGSHSIYDYFGSNSGYSSWGNGYGSYSGSSSYSDYWGSSGSSSSSSSGSSSSSSSGYSIYDFWNYGSSSSSGSSSGSSSSSYSSSDYYNPFDYGYSYGGTSDYDELTDLLGSLFGGSYGSSSGIDASDLYSLFGRSINVEKTAEFIAENSFDADALDWTVVDGRYVMELSEAQWALVSELELNVFLDDGEGFIDLGLDNVFDFDDNGNLIGEYDGTWLAVNGQPVAYYYTGSEYNDDGSFRITGYIPALVNGVRSELLVVFDDENPDGYIAGVHRIYTDGETATVAKASEGLAEGDVIDFLCDFYTYDGQYSDTYCLGEQMTYTGEAVISNVYIGNSGGPLPAYLFTDIYNNSFWTPVVPNGAPET